MKIVEPKESSPSHYYSSVSQLYLQFFLLNLGGPLKFPGTPLHIGAGTGAHGYMGAW